MTAAALVAVCLALLSLVIVPKIRAEGFGRLALHGASAPGQTPWAVATVGDSCHATGFSRHSTNTGRGKEFRIFEEEYEVEVDLRRRAIRSLLGTEALGIITSMHHLDQLGTAYVVPAALVVGLPLVLLAWFLNSLSRIARWAYGIVVALLIVGFGSTREDSVPNLTPRQSRVRAPAMRPPRCRYLLDPQKLWQVAIGARPSVAPSYALVPSLCAA